MNQWQSKNLTELAEFINGYSFKPSDWGKEGLPIIRIEQLKNPESVSDFYSKNLPQHNIIDDGDLVFSWSASLFLKIWQHGKSALNQHLFKVESFSDVDKLFLKYLIEFNLPELIKSAHGSTMQHITRKELNKFRVNLPESKIEQEKIAAVLSSVDRAVEQTEALIAKQKRIKQGLLHDLLTGGIDENGNLRTEATHEFKDSPLGRIPKEWSFCQLVDVVPTVQYGISSSLNDETGIPILRMNNLKNGEADITDLRYSESPEAKRILLKPKDVLFNRTNSLEHVGRTGIWQSEIAEASFASYLVRLNPDLNKIFPEYLNFWLNQESVQSMIKVGATVGVHQVNINPTNLRQVFISLPSKLEEQENIIEIIEKNKRNDKIELAKLKKLQAIKKGLMQDLLTGKVRVGGE